MTGVTHKEYSVTFGLIAMIIIGVFGLNEVNILIQTPIILLFSKLGAKFPDLDIELGEKECTFLEKLINRLIYFTGGKHRSWQTHSWDICLIFCLASIITPKILYIHYVTEVEMEILTIMLVGFSIGWVSHLFSDMLTPAGVRVLFWWRYKIRFVPKKFMWQEFRTGSNWEILNRKVVKLINIALVGSIIGIFII